MTGGAPFHRIGIAGTGRVARALALALAPHSAAPLLLWGRAPERLAAAIAETGCAAAPSQEALVENCDVILLAVADDAIGPVAAELARMLPAGCHPFVGHVSGRSGAALLDPLRSKGASTAAIHPVMTFTGDAAQEVRRMAGARFAITAAGADAMRRARSVVDSLGGVAVEIAEDDRALYHAALSHAANHLVTLLDGAAGALRAAGVDEPEALLAPLVRAALENSLAHGFDALSGPLLRGDGETVADHLAALERRYPELLPAYRAMARATLDALERRRASSTSELRQIVEGQDASAK